MNSRRLTSGMIPRLRFAASVTIGQDAADAADRALGWLSHFNMKRGTGTSGTFRRSLGAGYRRHNGKPSIATMCRCRSRACHRLEAMNCHPGIAFPPKS
jgi:hypothetical protein